MAACRPLISPDQLPLMAWGACKAGTYQDQKGASACLLCGSTTTSGISSTVCWCNAGYSGLPRGHYQWQLHGIPPFSARWFAASHSQHIFRISASCQDGDLPELLEYCGNGQTIHLTVASPEADAEWSAPLTITSLPLSMFVSFNGSGFYFAISGESLQGSQSGSADGLLANETSWGWMRLAKGLCSDQVSARFRV